MSRVLASKGLKPFDPSKIIVKPQQLCRGLPSNQFLAMLRQEQIQFAPKKNIHDVSCCDIGRQVMQGGDPNLMAFSPSLETANQYGANRYWLPREGVLIITGMPAVFSDISEQARLCPQLCAEEDKRLHEWFSTRYGGMQGYGHSYITVATRAMSCNEICAVVGKQDGVSFSNMFSINNFVQTVLHVIGTGRSHYGLVPLESCMVEAFHNPDYIERALALKIVLTNKPEFLGVIETTMRRRGELQPDQRVLTAFDAAVILGDPELRQLATTPSPSGTTILYSVPKEIHGQDLVAYLKESLKEQLSLLSQDNGHKPIK